MDRKKKEKYLETFHFPFCGEITKYEMVTKIGQGTFGEVFKARDRKNSGQKFVAVKRLLVNDNKQGFPITALREIRILQQLKHENIINLIEICRDKSKLGNSPMYCLVFEFCEHDLAGLLKNRSVKFNLGEIKKVMQQLLNGLYHIHFINILHRDLKPANILMTKGGVLKLADFGLARPFTDSGSEPLNYTNRVVTLWYRPPELLLGARNYGTAIDMWGAGCIMAELWTRCPIMQGGTEQQQLNLISRLCGSIIPEVWPEVQDLDLFNKVELPKDQKRKVKDRLKPWVKDAFACDLLDKLLTLDPRKRYDANSALDHDFFWMEPMPCDLTKMLKQHTHSMFDYFPRQPVRGISAQPSTSTADSGYQDRIF